MIFQASNFSIAALAVLSILPGTADMDHGSRPLRARAGLAAMQQAQPRQEPAVNIQTAAGPRRGGPAVLVTVNKSRVRVGETVTFTLTPSTLVNNPRYNVTVDFGDGTRRQVRETEVTHQYRATGHYKVYASALSTGALGDRDEPRRPVQQIPRVSLSAGPTPVAVGRTVTFTAQLSSGYPNIKYRFVFGDRSGTDWQDNPSATHSYAAAGTYSAYVDIGLADSGFVKQVAGSVRRPVQVNQAPFGPVQLEANPAPGEAGQSVTFNARVTSSDPTVRYRFVFGDRSPGTPWQASSQTTHAYLSAGNYPASVDVGIVDNRSVRQVGNATRPVRINPQPPIGVALIANPTSVEKGTAVSFSARSGAADRNVRFRFFFGDGSRSSGWQDSPHAVHKYADSGSYSAYVEIRRSGGARSGTIARSGVTQISVTPPATAAASPSPSSSRETVAVTSPSSEPAAPIAETSPEAGPPSGSSLFTRLFGGGLQNNWWKYLLLVLLSIALAYKLVKWLMPPPTTFNVYPDPGGSYVNTETKDLAIASEVLLRPDISEAQYLVHTNGEKIVKNLRRENA